MLPRNQRMELLSKAYFQAVVTQAGGTCAVPIPDFGIDFSIHYIAANADEGVVCHVQLKSTTTVTYQLDEDCYLYDLEVKAYRFLQAVDVKVPRILVLYVMPDDEELWLSQDNEGLILRSCAYFVSLAGMPETENERKVRIMVPRPQVFSVAFLRQRFQER